MKWEDYAIEFKWDGGWRDIYVLETSLADWQKMLNFLYASDYKWRYTIGDSEDLPQSVAGIFDEKHEDKGYLCVQVGDVDLNCHFFSSDEIEFDLDPRDIKSEEQILPVFNFMSQLVHLLNKEVVLTSENDSRNPIFRFSPMTQELHYVPQILKMMGPSFADE